MPAFAAWHHAYTGVQACSKDNICNPRGLDAHTSTGDGWLSRHTILNTYNGLTCMYLQVCGGAGVSPQYAPSSSQVHAQAQR